MTKEDIIQYLAAPEESPLRAELALRAASVKHDTVGDKVYLRGLVEFSNRCRKNCYYCGIRCGNDNVARYEMSDQSVLAAARYAFEQGYGSVVIQAGERCDSEFTEHITRLVSAIGDLSQGSLGVTLSLGEQSAQVYRMWRQAGAHRYLLRIESSSREIYGRIHPADHSFDRRIEALEALRAEGYQLGTGVMIGLPFQRIEDMADDLLFLQRMDIDMCGMGPYIEHPDAPLAYGAQSVGSAFSLDERYALSLKMISILRIMMPSINIASTTALHALNPLGRQAGIAAGGNVIMPNLSPSELRQNYSLYSDKPMHDMDLEGFDIAYGCRGDSQRWRTRE